MLRFLSAIAAVLATTTAPALADPMPRDRAVETLRAAAPRATDVALSDPLFPGDTQTFVRVTMPWRGWGGQLDVAAAAADGARLLSAMAAIGRAEYQLDLDVDVPMTGGGKGWFRLRWHGGAAARLGEADAADLVGEASGFPAAVAGIVAEWCAGRAAPACSTSHR